MKALEYTIEDEGKVTDASDTNTKFVQTLIIKDIINEDDISKLLNALEASMLIGIAEKVKRAFEEFKTYVGTPNRTLKTYGSHKQLDTSISYVSSTKKDKQEIRVIQCIETVHDEKLKIRICHTSEEECSTSKVILVFGKSGAGKTTMINAFVNNILGVKWEDEFRFKIPLDDEEAKCRPQIYRQTQWISAYCLHGHDIVIVDTPGFCANQGDIIDRELTDQIREFFCHPESKIKHVNMVAFVLKASDDRLDSSQQLVFRLVLDIFGNDMKENIYLFASFAEEKGKLPVKEAALILRIPFSDDFRFNNIALYRHDDDDDDDDDYTAEMKLKWKWGQDNFQLILESLSESKGVATDLTIKVLEQRISLELQLSDILEVIRSAIVKIAELQNDRKAAEEHREELNQSHSFSYHVIEEFMDYVTIQQERAMVCHTCRRTCHYPCHSRFTFLCNEMRWFSISRGCSVCDRNCSPGQHEITNNKYIRKTRTVIKESEHLKQQHIKATYKAEIKVNDILQTIEKKEKQTREVIANRLFRVWKYLKSLEKIALSPNTKQIKEYLQDMITTQIIEGKVGWVQRVSLLETFLDTEM